MKNKEIEEFKGNLVDYIYELKQKADLADHYKRLYSEVKKQKDDVVKVLYQLKGSARWERHLYEIDYMLRMLGDKDE